MRMPNAGAAVPSGSVSAGSASVRASQVILEPEVSCPSFGDADRPPANQAEQNACDKLFQRTMIKAAGVKQ
jgi:hypothetical protein